MNSKLKAFLLSCFVVVCTAPAALQADTIPPSKPLNFNAVVISDTEIALSWDRSIDNKRVKNYRLLRNGTLIKTTGKLQFSDRGLTPETLYDYAVIASDGVNLSLISTLTATTTTSEESNPQDPPETDSPKKGRGKPKPPAEEPPIEEPPTEEPPTSSVPAGWQLVFSDEFTGSGDLDVTSSDKNWRFETMQSGLHRAGNSGINAEGQIVAPWESAQGKRWSGWYNQHNSSNVYRENGTLIMGGFHSFETDPTRPVSYVDNGVQTDYGQSKLYTGWIDTWSRKWVGPDSEHVVDPDSPAKSFKYGYFETRVDFSGMQTPGFRLSLWLMPASTDAEGQNLVVSNAYDSDGNNGVEIDIFEYEWINAAYENRIQLAIHGGAAGSSSTNFDASTLDVNLHNNYHVIGFLWTADRIVWYIDGKIAKEVTNVSLIPDVYSYIIVSREMNSGVKNPDSDSIISGDMIEELPYRPRDPGLYAKNIWEFRDTINTDRAIIDYLKVWQP